MNVPESSVEQSMVSGMSKFVVVISGILGVIAGIFAIATPFFAGIAFTKILGVILVVGSIVHLVREIIARRGIGSFLLGLIVSILYFVAGVFLISNLLVGLYLITLTLGMVFTVIGLLKIAVSLDVSGKQGWGWILVNGIITLILGLWILAALPKSMLWALGIVVGVDLIFYGASLITGTFSIGRQEIPPSMRLAGEH